jgi:hypothetical protein
MLYRLLYQSLIIILLMFLVFLNIVLFDITEPLYFMLLLSSIIGSYAITRDFTRGFVSYPR